MQKKTKVSQSPSVLSIIAKAFRPRQTWDDKVGNAFIRNCERRNRYSGQDQFMDVIHWTRQLLALILGCVWGVIPLHGIVGLLL